MPRCLSREYQSPFAAQASVNSWWTHLWWVGEHYLFLSTKLWGMLMSWIRTVVGVQCIKPHLWSCLTDGVSKSPSASPCCRLLSNPAHSHIIAVMYPVVFFKLWSKQEGKDSWLTFHVTGASRNHKDSQKQRSSPSTTKLSFSRASMHT